MKKSIKLEHCPFCGEKDLLSIRVGKYYQPVVRRSVICWSCYASSGWFKTGEEAAEAWNRREDNGTA